MFVTIVHVKVKPGHIEDFIRASESNHLQSVKEPGNLRFDILQKGDDPGEFALYEAYENQEAAAAHKETAHYLSWRETVAPWMAEARKGVVYNGLMPLMKKVLLLMLPALLLFACHSPKPADNPSEKPAAAVWTLNEIWRTSTVLRTCESVLYDEKRDVLFVSCINGAPAEKNGMGYIAKLGPDGSVQNPEWIRGLNAPKGMGIHEGLLYVTDIDQLTIIDIEKAELILSIPVEGAGFLNDVAIDSDGTVYFSDSNTGCLWTYKEGTLSPWIEGAFQRPNGLLIEEDRVLLTSSGSSDLKVIDKVTREFETVTTDIGLGDGLEFTGKEGHYLVTDWTGEVFLILPDFSRISLLKTSDQEINSADIGFNEKKQVVYVPTFFDNRVVAYRLSHE